MDDMQRFHEKMHQDLVHGKKKRFKASRSCALCHGSGTVEDAVHDIDSDCPCTETGHPVVRNPSNTSIQKAKIAKARKKRREAAKKRLSNRR